MMFPFEFGLLALYSAKIFFAIFDVRQGAKTLAPQRPPLKSLPSHLSMTKMNHCFSSGADGLPSVMNHY